MNRLCVTGPKVLVLQFFNYSITKLLIYQIFHIISLRAPIEAERALNTFDLAGNVYFLAAAFFLFGLLFGSFLNVCIYRMPREISVVSPRSACPACEAPIAAYDNIPVVSWLVLGGKCRKCKATISPRYAAVELLTGVLFAASYLAALGKLPGAVPTSDTLCDATGGPLTAAI